VIFASLLLRILDRLGDSSAEGPTLAELGGPANICRTPSPAFTKSGSTTARAQGPRFESGCRLYWFRTIFGFPGGRVSRWWGVLGVKVASRVDLLGRAALRRLAELRGARVDRQLLRDAPGAVLWTHSFVSGDKMVYKAFSFCR
jgi:hypothetical protein